MVAVLAEKQSEIAGLCDRFGVRQLEVFGSAASEESFDPRKSDVDFIVEFHPNQDLGPWLEKYFSLRDGLSKLLGHPVDLVMASAMKNPYFIREANRTRRLLYGEYCRRPQQARLSTTASCAKQLSGISKSLVKQWDG